MGQENLSTIGQHTSYRFQAETRDAKVRHDSVGGRKLKLALFVQFTASESWNTVNTDGIGTRRVQSCSLERKPIIRVYLQLDGARRSHKKGKNTS
jgi:hypothetical protein